MRSKFAAFVMAVCLWVTAAGSPVGSNARAETAQIRFAVGPSLTYLVFTVMESEKLVQKHAAAAGLPEPAVSYQKLASNDGIRDALLSGSVEIGSMGVPAFLPLWEKSKGGTQEVKGVGAFNALPLVLVTSNPNVKTIADFTEKDRIAVPGVLNSTQAYVLQMAAEKAFGPGNHKKLDTLTISRGHPDAMAAMLQPGSEITAHFSAPPFSNIALAKPGIRKILTTHEVYNGPGTNGVAVALKSFHDANPKSYGAIVAAMKEGMAMINANRRRAAEIHVEIIKDKAGVEAVHKILDAPDMVFTLTPNGTKQVAEFMHRIGTLKTKPESWKDLFFPAIHDLQGS
jgi:NitT/TauT family transport system substrate-binding protein